MTWLVDADAVEGRDFQLDQLLPFWQVASEQDWALCERNQRGLLSAGYRQGRVHPPVKPARSLSSTGISRRHSRSRELLLGLAHEADLGDGVDAERQQLGRVPARLPAGGSCYEPSLLHGGRGQAGKPITSRRRRCARPRYGTRGRPRLVRARRPTDRLRRGRGRRWLPGGRPNRTLPRPRPAFRVSFASADDGMDAFI